MTATATVRVMSPEEIAARAGGQAPFLHWPQRASLFAEREMRLRQLAPGHAMGDFLVFMADLARAQQQQLSHFPSTVLLPDDVALAQAALNGRPPLPAADWPRDPAWQRVLQGLVADLRSRAPAGVQPTLERLAAADDLHLERQADALLNGVMAGLDLAGAPLVAAALQVYWSHLLLSLREHHGGGDTTLPRIADDTVCPCCGSRPTTSITRSAGESLGQRYLHCSLCSLQWHMVRIQCSHCRGSGKLAYQALDTLDTADAATPGEAASPRAAQAVIQAETCDDCGHYMKIMHTDRDAFVEPVADDLASLTLDLLVSDTGQRRHGINLMLLFGEPDPPGEHLPPDPGGD